jgi:hypothetical protein
MCCGKTDEARTKKVLSDNPVVPLNRAMLAARWETMNKYESFRRSILERAAEASKWDGDIYANIFSLAVEYNIPPSHVREQLMGLAAEGLISLAANDGQSERLFTEWPDKNSFFFDGGAVRIRLLSAGGELLSSLPKTRIGFAATSK